MLYCADKRPEIEAEHADDPEFDIHKALARSWRDLGAEGQKPWMEKYAEIKSAAGKDKDKEKKKGGVRGDKGGDIAEDDDDGDDDDDDDEGKDEEKEKEKEKGEGQGSKRRTGGFTAVNR